MKKLCVMIVLLFWVGMMAQDKKAYQLFDANGKKVSYKKLLKSASESQVVLFGEFHNNAISHWLELELTKDIATTKSIVQGAEMLEADNQKQLNQYLNGEVDQKKLDSIARLWKNYPTDYKPLVDFAKEHKNPFIATNIPRRYAAMVSKKGFEALETLTDEEKSWMAPQPIPYDANLPGYMGMMKMMGKHASPNMPKSQASKDATMAHFINKNLKEGSVYIHYNGSYHSDKFEGIYWYLKKYNPDIKIVTISTVEQKELTKLYPENLYKADFILVVDEDMTKTYPD
ncbi:ChaN family lipoprotein [Flavobacterium aciduliphilum]|uniref:Putative iron-regulated protein n=1 Tax=Flavobacterium aciduliphilum TaxID=1101402 RepID=A0A328YBJ4_9FLAO|nr:ChaN family lipoprotein [Flavobacterium aciduliphilum]RAR71348.1 putative iron-regulated protein [Flavobacterium aciduliphilum]